MGMFLLKDTRGRLENTNKETKDENLSAENISIRDKRKNPSYVPEFEDDVFTNRMINLIREFVIFSFLMCAYLAFTGSSPKVSKAPAAYPFFPKDSYVVDWYRGEISKAIEFARSSDIAFLMFYAPWDAESQAARKEFEAAARAMHKYVSFAAVNCWQPKSECSIQYNKVYNWPVLIAYPSFGRGIQYNGPITSAHMIQFLKKVCWPLKRFPDELIDGFEEGYILAELNVQPGSWPFVVYYIASLKYLEKDPLYRLTFYIKPTIKSNLTLKLHLWNETKSEEFAEFDWKPENILHWVYKHTDQASSWIAPTGTKSSVLSNLVHSSPTIILFTPKNPLYETVDYYSMFQEVAQDYMQCENTSLLLHSELSMKRIRNFMQHAYLESICRHKPESPKIKIIPHKMWANSSICATSRGSQFSDCNIAIKNNVAYICHELSRESCVEHLSLPNDRVCDSVKHSHTAYHIKTSMLRPENDVMSIARVKEALEKEKCRQHLMAQKIHPAIFEDLRHKTPNVNITGLGCKTNKSLQFIAMDSLTYYHFAERLGIDLFKQKDKSAVVIIDNMMESHFILERPVNSAEIKGFILNFTMNSLPRSLNSSTSVVLRKTHSYSTKESFLNNFSVQELDSKSFLPTVLENNRVVVVFYYSKQCAFCSGINHIFLTVARKLCYVQNLKFVRIDGEVNILPWEYAMEKFPRILFFPSKRKSETRVFPSDVKVTVSNLIGFILSNLQPNLRLQSLWSICVQMSIQQDKSRCFLVLQRNTLSTIENSLREWRKSNRRQQQLILYNLRQLKQLHLLFALQQNKRKVIISYFKKLNNNESVEYKSG